MNQKNYVRVAKLFVKDISPKILRSYNYGLHWKAIYPDEYDGDNWFKHLNHELTLMHGIVTAKKELLW